MNAVMPVADADYRSFLSSKIPAAPIAGMVNPPPMRETLKSFQRDVTQWGLRRGRGTIFAGTGLGKTVMELSWSEAVAQETRRPVLLLAPLAVAQQTVEEAQKFNIDGVAYAADRSQARTPIVVSNYERLDKFDLSEFGGVVLDESSILKAFDGKTRNQLVEACASIYYRLPCSATPAPNDYLELGNHAEFLGVMTYKEMLATWFVHDGSARATNVENYGQKVSEWRLKRHAEEDFWRWVAEWAVVFRHPADIGYDEPGYDLPPLNKHHVTVPFARRDGELLAPIARTLQERLAARRDTIGGRVAAAVEMVNAAPDRPWLVWCNLNDESTQLAAALTNAVEVRGADHPDAKASRLLGFAHGDHRVLVSKPSIAGWGMNFQRCADMVFVGLNDSFEQLYQAIRRCWRFGQTRPVNAYLIASEIEGAVVANLEAKERQAEEMYAAMARHMSDLSARAVHGTPLRTISQHDAPMQLPEWLS